MQKTAFDSDRVLTDFLTDYLDGNLSTAEKNSFEDYLAENEKERSFARKAMKGKKTLSRLAGRINLSKKGHSLSSV
jgi:anti-sigma factor RsiW